MSSLNNSEVNIENKTTKVIQDEGSSLEQNLLNKRRKQYNCFIAKQLKKKRKTKCVLFLSFEEEQAVLKHYANQIKILSKMIKPPIPKHVLATALQYFQRFFLQYSVMAYSPCDMALACLYRACKRGSFEVSIELFVNASVNGTASEREQRIEKSLKKLARKTILFGYELNPFNAIDGLMLELEATDIVSNKFEMRMQIERILASIIQTDVILMYVPIFICTAGLLIAADYCKYPIKHDELYKFVVMRNLQVLEHKNHIVKMVESNAVPKKKTISLIESKLKPILEITAEDESDSNEEEDTNYSKNEKENQYVTMSNSIPL